MKPTDWLTAAGLVTWLASGVPSALAIAGGRLTGVDAVAWLVAFAAFGIAFSLICFAPWRGLRFRRALVLTQSIAGPVMVLVSRAGIAGATPVGAEAHAIAGLLLGDGRAVVSRLRESSHCDLAAAIRSLADAATGLQVHVDAADVTIDDPLQAHAILRCVQEVITNAMRHAQARNLWISVERRDDGIALTARDDGRGVDAVTWGNGLRGMRERFEELSGRVDFSSRPGAGFEVQAFVPK